MSRYWTSSFFLRVYGLRRSRGPSIRKKRTRPISSHLDRTSVVNKEFIIWDKTQESELCTCGTKRVIPRGQDRSILPARVATHIINRVNKITMTAISTKFILYLY